STEIACDEMTGERYVGVQPDVNGGLPAESLTGTVVFELINPLPSIEVMSVVELFAQNSVSPTSALDVMPGNSVAAFGVILPVLSIAAFTAPATGDMMLR